MNSPVASYTINATFVGIIIAYEIPYEKWHVASRCSLNMGGWESTIS